MSPEKPVGSTLPMKSGKTESFFGIVTSSSSGWERKKVQSATPSVKKTMQLTNDSTPLNRMDFAAPFSSLVVM